MPPAALLIGGVAAAGAVSGAQKQKVTSQQGINVAKANDREKAAAGMVDEQFKQLQGMTAAGPGQADVEASVGASRDLATMLQQMSSSSGMPGQADITQANSLANNLFQARQLGLQQSFQDQTTQANRQAALMGRSMNDPVLRAKLAQEQTRQSAMLGAEQGATAQQLALQMPGQRLQFASSRADLLGGLASQAMANRQAILSLGSGIEAQEKNWRFQTGTKWGTQESGGGLAGALNGGLAGLGTGMSMFGGGTGMGGGRAPMGMSTTPSAPAGGMGGMGGGMMAAPQAQGYQYSLPAGPELPSSFQGPYAPSFYPMGYTGPAVPNTNNINLGNTVGMLGFGRGPKY